MKLSLRRILRSAGELFALCTPFVTTAACDHQALLPPPRSDGAPVPMAAAMSGSVGTRPKEDPPAVPIPDAPVVAGIPGAVPGPGATVEGCKILPNDSVWNVRVDGPGVRVIHNYDQTLPQSKGLHPDLGAWTPKAYGLPWMVVPANQKLVPVSVEMYEAESDKGPNGDWSFPFPLGMRIESNPKIDGGRPGDQHAIVLQHGSSETSCQLWEAYGCFQKSNNTWSCANTAHFDLSHDGGRPDKWTSGDAAGLPIFPGLVRVSEVIDGAIRHALRVTLSKTARSYIAPASHASGRFDVANGYPPMGLRLRLKPSFDLGRYSGDTLVILTAMKQYGLILADVGSDWFFQGDSDDRWGDKMKTLLHDFREVHGSDFEAVYSGNPRPM